MLIFAAIAGHDDRDPITSRTPVQVDLAARALRVAVSSAWIERNAHPEVASAVLAVARFFKAKEVEAPDFDLLSAHCLTVMQAEASAQHAQWMRERSQDYSSAVRVRLEAGYAIPAVQYLEALRLRSVWLERFTATTVADADLYLCPAIPVPIPMREETGPRGGPEMPKRLAEVTRLTRWVNYLGVPALVVPCGFDSRGLPIGLQLVGRPFAEGTLLTAGERYQRDTDWHQRIPPELR